MLTDEERRELEEALPHYPSRRSAAITALKIVQRHRGWLSDEALADVSAFLRVSVDELDTLATFYNLLYRRPVGRHVILVCDSMVCWALGHERLVGRSRTSWTWIWAGPRPTDVSRCCPSSAWARATRPPRCSSTMICTGRWTPRG